MFSSKNHLVLPNYTKIFRTESQMFVSKNKKYSIQQKLQQYAELAHFKIPANFVWILFL